MAKIWIHHRQEIEKTFDWNGKLKQGRTMVYCLGKNLWHLPAKVHRGMVVLLEKGRLPAKDISLFTLHNLQPGVQLPWAAIRSSLYFHMDSGKREKIQEKAKRKEKKGKCQMI